ncbi:MAG: hypothetical protein KDE25_02840 [Novosphingobium sp.]|nr:hypothetical protein [Novosphingobium sp.]
MPGSSNRQNGLSVGFLTALVSDELTSTESVLQTRGWEKARFSNELDRAGIASWKKAIDGREIFAFSSAVNEMGQAQSAIETMSFLMRTRCQINFLVGIAGSLKRKQVHREDVIIGKEVYWWAQNRLTSGDPCDIYRKKEHRLPTYNRDLLRRMERYCNDNYRNIPRDEAENSVKHVSMGGIYSWDYVLSNEARVQQINHEHPQADCVEMEAGGFLSAIGRYVDVEKRPAKGFVIRGISDYADKKSKEKKVRVGASRRAAEVAVDLAEWMTTVEQVGYLSSEF